MLLPEFHPTDPGAFRGPLLLRESGELALAHRPCILASRFRRQRTRKIIGGPGKTSIRASYGMFYTAIEALTIGVMSANAPCTERLTPAPLRRCFPRPSSRLPPAKIWANTFPCRSPRSTRAPVTRTRTSIGRSSSPLPDFRTIQLPIVFLIPKNIYSLERALGSSTILSLNYVGTQAHRLLRWRKRTRVIRLCACS